jgi:hypothetical protein
LAPADGRRQPVQNLLSDARRVGALNAACRARPQRVDVVTTSLPRVAVLAPLARHRNAAACATGHREFCAFVLRASGSPSVAPGRDAGLRSAVCLASLP